MLSERVIGKKAWVTGAAHGIGRASAWALAEAGADVAISDINEKGLEETAEYIRKLGRKALVLPADITKENEIEETINTIVDKWGKLDIAYCNAGTFQDIPAEDMPLEEFERVIKVNLTGAFISSRAAGKAMIKQKSGSIILTASMSGHIVNIPQCQCAYNSSKAGVDEKAVYKPYVMKNDTGWIMWYNGAMYIPDSEEIVREQIGVAYLKRENLWNE